MSAASAASSAPPAAAAAAASASAPAASTGFGCIPTHRHTDYTTRYRCREQDDDYAMHTHGNGISVLTLAPTHPLRRLQKTIDSISWHGQSAKANQSDRSQQRVTGKRKKGGIMLEPNSVLCQVKCTDGSSYNILASVHGKLVEVNAALRSSPQLLVTHAAWEGYLALFALSAKHKNLLSVSDRLVEGSEAERDRAEERTVNRDAALVPLTDSASAPSPMEDMGSAAGADWRSNLEYLRPSEYEERRKNLFVAR